MDISKSNFQSIVSSIHKRTAIDGTNYMNMLNIMRISKCFMSFFMVLIKGKLQHINKCCSLVLIKSPYDVSWSEISPGNGIQVYDNPIFIFILYHYGG